MANQRNNVVIAAIRRETAINVQATATGATQMRIVDSPGLQLKRAPIQSNEHQTNNLKPIGRLGYKTVDGSFNSELSVGGHHDLLDESIMRSAWATATAVAFSTMTIAITTNALTATSGSFLTNGVRVGDIFVVSGTSVSGNNNLNVRALAVTTLTISVATGTYTTLAATVTGTLTILKKLVNPTTPTRYSYSVEQYSQDIDQSELFTGCRHIGRQFSYRPGQPVTVQDSFMGVDRQILTSGASPYFTSPSATTGLALLVEDATIRYNALPIASVTGWDLNFAIEAAGQPVAGSVTTQDIYDNDLSVTLTVQMTRADLSNLTLFDAETEFDFSFLLQEPNTGPPKSCFAMFLSRIKIAELAAPFMGGGDGATVESLTFMVGPKVAATGYDAGYLTMHSSAP